MHLYRPKVPVCVAMACSGVALSFQLAAVIGTGWLVWSFTMNRYTIGKGLFRYCVEFTDTCSTYDKPEDWIKACQAFSMLALGAMFGSFVVGILHILREDAQGLTLLAAGVNVVAAVNVAVEVGVYAAENNDLIMNSMMITISYGYCFYLSIAAGALSVVAAILYVVGRVPVRQ
ncbi:hypothetical protein C0Q70_07514 [Pomacea canaliculata]|uniref:Claudin n=1 Tax=Pomacea canaliculata TaxID=400727 RepID=A0A2T7PF81_POMCA|nr:uncharacterized protein LOC112562870 [Pomacea canaliculata]PVD32086.1 hypothetical protein C0Q70_07514 [Pomacea canaliculata]